MKETIISIGVLFYHLILFLTPIAVSVYEKNFWCLLLYIASFFFARFQLNSPIDNSKKQKLKENEIKNEIDKFNSNIKK